MEEEGDSSRPPGTGRPLRTQRAASWAHFPSPCPVGALAGAALTWALLLSLHGQDTLAQLAVEPELHPDEGFTAFLRQLAPRLWPGQHVTDAALGQA